MSEATVGFIGLGNMGGPMASNLAASGQAMTVFDAAGTQARAPEGATCAGSAEGVAAQCDTVFLSLPDGGAVRSVAAQLASAPGSRVKTIVDTSTIGTGAARAIHAQCLSAGIAFVDAPVSGGRIGAINASIAIMASCHAATFERLTPLLKPMAKNLFHVGERAGLGQAMKVLNNFLSGTAMVATAEAVAFGVGQGLEMSTILDVVNVSSGQNTAISDKFPNRVLTQTYDVGFTSRLFLKDLLLFEEAAKDAGDARPVSPAVVETWRQLEAAQPNCDMTNVYPFLRDRRFESSGD